MRQLRSGQVRHSRRRELNISSTGDHGQQRSRPGSSHVARCYVVIRYACGSYQRFSAPPSTPGGHGCRPCLALQRGLASPRPQSRRDRPRKPRDRRYLRSTTILIFVDPFAIPETPLGCPHMPAATNWESNPNPTCAGSGCMERAPCTLLDVSGIPLHAGQVYFRYKVGYNFVCARRVILKTSMPSCQLQRQPGMS